ncbi:hypothetical protein PGH42_08405 [Legionella pneumophila]|nr:hypothetical protein PGH42_08405 [Legionella pneumophila]
MISTIMPIITALNVSKETLTMKTKIVPTFLYEGLGFPIELGNVEAVKFNGEWLPKIDLQYIADEVIKKLAIQEERLTGNQVKFIRSYFSIPLSANGKVMGMK